MGFFRINFFTTVSAAAPAAPAAPAGSSEQALGSKVLNFRLDLDLWGVMVNTINFLLNIGILLAILFIGVGAVQYITATGDKNKATTAIETLKWSIIGLCGLLGFKVLLSIFTNLFG